MRLGVLTSTIMILLFGGCTAASAQEGSEGAEFFVRDIYGFYRDGRTSSIDEAQLDAVWSPRMAALIRRGRELANGELSHLDGDPLCKCRDFENLTFQRVQIRQNRLRPDVVRMANVEVISAGRLVKVILALSGDPIQGWRIDDVVNEEGLPSLAEALAASNASMEAEGGLAQGPR